MDGVKEKVMVFAHVIGADVPFLIGRSMLEEWGLSLDMVNGILEVELSGERRRLSIVITNSGHYGLEVESEECVKEEKWMKKRKRRRERIRQMKLMIKEMENCEKCGMKKEMVKRKESEERSVQDGGYSNSGIGGV